MPEVYLLAGALVVASLFAIIMRRFRQPLVVSYILAGALLSVFGFVKPNQLFFLKSIPEISLAFLLFLVGMELDLNEFRHLGAKVLTTAIGQVLVSGLVLTFVLSNFLPVGPAFLIAVSLSVSSTILVVKLLIEHRDQSSLHGKMAIGVTLVEDLVAVFVLVILAVSAGHTVGPFTIIAALFKGLFLIWLALITGVRLLPRLTRSIADSTELLFLTAIAWCLLFVCLSIFLGFSVSIGAFLAGVSLAQSTYRIQISGKIKPLRDFFIMLFFINVGAQLNLSALENGFGLALFLTLYMAVGKSIIIFILLVLNRFRARSAFQTAILLSSISEFSLIILFSLSNSGLVTVTILPPIIFAVILSFISSSFLITHSHFLYRRLGFLLKRVERKKTLSLDFVPEKENGYKDHAVLVGCHRSGHIILKSLKRLFGDNFLVIDFNPDVIEELKANYIPCLFGDAADPEILERLDLKEARLIISTVRDLNDNLALLDAIEKVQSKAVTIITAADVTEAISLYERGAHHVSLPLNLEGASINHLLNDHIHNLAALAADRERKLGELKRHA